MVLHLDFETFSQVQLDAVGAVRYAADPSTEVLCAAYAEDDGPVECWEPGMDPPRPVIEAIESGEVPIHAHGALFELAVLRYTTSRLGWPVPRYKQMRCTLARSAYAGLPRGLDSAAASMSLKERKDPDGKRLIAMFCELQRGTKKKPRWRILPSDEPEEFGKLIAYCKQDVVTERALDKVLPDFPPIEQIAFDLDVLVNSRGFPMDLSAIDAAARIMDVISAEYLDLTDLATNGISPTQRDKLLAWLQDGGMRIADLQRATLEELMKRNDLPPLIREVLEMRMEVGRAAPKKLRSMLGVAVNGRAHGTLVFYGAHTGRWSGRVVQPHNFPRGEMKALDVETAFKLILTRDVEAFRIIFDQPAATISSCMRGFIAAEPGNELYVVDFSAIEARVLVWLAGQDDMVKAYEQGFDLYIIMASWLYGVAPGRVTGEQRRIGKNLILGCGYSLGAVSFVDYCANAGSIVTEEFAQFAVKAYRDRHPKVVSYWYEIENAAVDTIRTGRPHAVIRNGIPIRFWMDGKTLTCDLPSGRSLFYRDARIVMVEGFRGPRPQIEYLVALGARFVRTSTYGGKLVENIVQALARDLLVIGMYRAEAAGYPVVLTVHDEIVCEVRLGFGSPEELVRIVTVRPRWGLTLPISAKGFRTRRYRKD